MLNISILAFSSSFLFSSPAFVNNHFSFKYSNFQRFSSVLFYNQKYLYIEKTKFVNGLNGIIINEKDTSNIHQTIQNNNYTSEIILNLDQEKSISIIDCILLNINSENAIKIKNDKISLYLTSLTIISCMSQNAVIHLDKARCLTMTHICTYNSGSINEGGILTHDIMNDDFSLCLYSTFVNSSVGNEGSSSIIIIKNGNQYFRCNNLTKSDHRGFHFNTPWCFSFGLSTVMNCKGSCFMLSGFDQSHCSNITSKEIHTTNFLNEGENMIEFYGTCSYKLTIINCVLLNNNPSCSFAIKEKPLTIVVQNCIILSNFQNKDDNIKFIGCKTVEYDESYITLHAHYTHGDYCVGPGKYDKYEYGCDSGNCVDQLCGKTIGFPSGVVRYTTVCFNCTSSFSDSIAFSESEKFSFSEEFSESEKFTKSNRFTSSSRFSSSYKFSIYDSFTYTSHPLQSSTKISTYYNSITDSESTEFFIVPDNQGTKEKGANKAMIGAISAAAVVVVIGAIVATVLIIKKRKSVNVTTDANMVETQSLGSKTENTLSNMMKDDDPFGEDFVAEMAPNGDVVL